MTTTTQLRTGSWIADDDRAELERKAAAYDELESVMPHCGHKQRYVYGTVTMNCALCVIESHGLTDALRGAKLVGKKKKTRR